MSITIKDVEYVAKLARLELTDQEKQKFTKQLDNILGYIEKLNEVDTSKVVPMLHSINDGNVLREDIHVKSIEHSQIIKNAPERENRFFKVKKVIE